jgi:hypothetical protein
MISSTNSTSTVLVGDAVFTGDAHSTNGYISAHVHVYADVASATNGVQLSVSEDGINWDRTQSYTLGTVGENSCFANMGVF